MQNSVQMFKAISYTFIGNKHLLVHCHITVFSSDICLCHIFITIMRRDFFVRVMQLLILIYLVWCKNVNVLSSYNLFHLSLVEPLVFYSAMFTLVSLHTWCKSHCFTILFGGAKDEVREGRYCLHPDIICPYIALFNLENSLLHCYHLALHFCDIVPSWPKRLNYCRNP